MYLFNILYLISIILLAPLYLKKLLNKKYRNIIKKRLFPDIKFSEKKRIWIHAVSVGEVKGLERFIGELKKKTDQNIVLSVTTLTGFDIAKKIFPDIDVINSPLDFSFAVKKFTKLINPKILILNELEIWPNWIMILKRRKIPIFLINGRISDKAFVRYKKFLFLLKPFFRKLSKVMIQGDWYKDRFTMMGVPVKNIISCGNIKADEAIAAAKVLPSSEKLRKDFKLGDKGKILVFASTHIDDENFFLPVLNELLKTFFIIIAPRHTKRSESLKKRISDHGVNSFLYSQTGKDIPNDGIMIFDEMGYLMKLMKLSDIVFMGGGFDRSVGGHNLYEPAILSKPIIGGPHFSNFPDIGSALVKAGVFRVLKSQEELLRISYELSLLRNYELIADEKNAVFSRSGAIECIIGQIEEFIN